MEKQIAQTLLQIKAIKLNPQNPFTWASGWKSPIYCDNRQILSHVEPRRLVGRALAEIIHTKYPDADLIVGVATGAIAWGLLAADRLDKPFAYVRPSPKGHGLANQIEGSYQKGQKVVVVEDLISTGGSSLAAVEALRAAELEVMGMVAIFTYGFPKATQNFQQANVTLDTLSNYNALIQTAIENQTVAQDQLQTLAAWRQNPESWGAPRVTRDV